MSVLSPWPYPKRCAHRGAGKLAPENTLASLRLGRSHGYRMAEIDVKLSADGVAFLLHDATLDRTTDGTGRADALTWRELARLDAGSWHSPAYAGEPLPTLAAVARYCRANGDATTLWKGAEVPPLISSFSATALEAALETAPALPRAWLTETLPPDWQERCKALGCIALDAKHTLLRADTVAAAHSAGLRVAAWTVNDPVQVAELASWGVDTIITDAVDTIT